jgi:hypothetical protein
MGTEIYKDVIWYEWLYQVSNLWNVKCLKAFWNKYWTLNKEIISKNTVLYWRRWLRKNWKIKRFLTSRLVAQAFHWLDINDKTILVCHKDDNPANNRTDNLFLWTQKDNMQDALNKNSKEYLFKKWINHPNSKQVLQYSLNWDFIKKWWWIREIHRELWINIWNISLCCNWKSKSAWWYTWDFI